MIAPIKGVEMDNQQGIVITKKKEETSDNNISAPNKNK
jgi:hypothetical protein